MTTDQTTDHIMLELLELGLFHERAPVPILAMKLGEEVGEFNEALMLDMGYMQHKGSDYEAPLFEAADIINVVTSILARHCNEQHGWPPERTLSELKKAIEKKGSKHSSIIDAPQFGQG